MNRKKIALLGVCATVLVAGVGGYAFKAVAGGSEAALIKKVGKRFPNTKITSANCDVDMGGLCEVVAGGQNVFYVSKDGNRAFVGAVLDTENKIDLTDKRLRELAAVNNVEGKLNGQPAAAAAPQQAAAAAAPASPTGPLKVTLPRDNAIVHNPGAAVKITIFTDLNCGYCHKLWEDLKTAPDIEVTEYPIAFLAADSRDKAKLALCSKDRVKAVAAIYGGGELTSPGNCEAADKAVGDNTAFAQANGITGTPTIVRADGQRISGWKPVADLRAFAKGA